MPALQVIDLNNGKQDLDHTAEIATSVALQATDRLGRTKRTLAGTLFDMAAFNPRGAWSASPTPSTYARKDIVTSGGVAYFATVDHAPSGSFATDLAAGKWAVHAGLTSLDFLTKLGRMVDSIANLQLVDKTQYSRCFVSGYYAQGDGGGGEYFLDAADTTSTHNGGTIIVASDGGRWKLRRQGPVSVKQFGAISCVLLTAAAMTNGSAAFSDAGGNFAAADVGKQIRVEGAGSDGGVLSTTIAGYTSATAVTLSAAASTTVTGKHALVGALSHTQLQAAIDWALADITNRDLDWVMGVYGLGAELDLHGANLTYLKWEGAGKATLFVQTLASNTAGIFKSSVTNLLHNNRITLMAGTWLTAPTAGGTRAFLRLPDTGADSFFNSQLLGIWLNRCHYGIHCAGPNLWGHTWQFDLGGDVVTGYIYCHPAVTAGQPRNTVLGYVRGDQMAGPIFDVEAMDITFDVELNALLLGPCLVSDPGGGKITLKSMEVEGFQTTVANRVLFDVPNTVVKGDGFKLFGDLCKIDHPTIVFKLNSLKARVAVPLIQLMPNLTSASKLRVFSGSKGNGKCRIGEILTIPSEGTDERLGTVVTLTAIASDGGGDALVYEPGIDTTEAKYRGDVSVTLTGMDLPRQVWNKTLNSDQIATLPNPATDEMLFAGRLFEIEKTSSAGTGKLSIAGIAGSLQIAAGAKGKFRFRLNRADPDAVTSFAWELDGKEVW